MEPKQDAPELYEVDRAVHYADRPGFRITELQISSTQKVPWHYHKNVQDTFYVVEGHIKLFMLEPKENVELAPGETHCVRARRPHMVMNAGTVPATFVVLQGIGEIDYVPLDR